MSETKFKPDNPNVFHDTFSQLGKLTEGLNTSLDSLQKAKEDFAPRRKDMVKNHEVTINKANMILINNCNDEIYNKILTLLND